MGPRRECGWPTFGGGGTAYLGIVRAANDVFDDQNRATLEDANKILNPEKNRDIGAGSLDKNRDKTTAQTLPAWLNCAKGSIARDEPTRHRRHRRGCFVCPCATIVRHRRVSRP